MYIEGPLCAHYWSFLWGMTVWWGRPLYCFPFCAWLTDVRMWWGRHCSLGDHWRLLRKRFAALGVYLDKTSWSRSWSFFQRVWRWDLSDLGRGRGFVVALKWEYKWEGEGAEMWAPAWKYTAKSLGLHVTMSGAIEEMDQGAGSRKTRGRGVGWEAWIRTPNWGLVNEALAPRTKFKKAPRTQVIRKNHIWVLYLKNKKSQQMSEVP